MLPNSSKNDKRNSLDDFHDKVQHCLHKLICVGEQRQGTKCVAAKCIANSYSIITNGSKKTDIAIKQQLNPQRQKTRVIIENGLKVAHEEHKLLMDTWKHPSVARHCFISTGMLHFKETLSLGLRGNSLQSAQGNDTARKDTNYRPYQKNPHHCSEASTKIDTLRKMIYRYEKHLDKHKLNGTLHTKALLLRMCWPCLF